MDYRGSSHNTFESTTYEVIAHYSNATLFESALFENPCNFTFYLSIYYQKHYAAKKQNK